MIKSTFREEDYLQLKEQIELVLFSLNWARVGPAPMLFPLNWIRARAAPVLF